METPKDRGPNRSIDMDVEPTVADAIKGLPGHGTHHNDGEPEDQPPTYMERVYSGEYEAPEPEGSLEGINDPDFDGCLNCGAKDSWQYTKGIIGESETSRVEGYGRHCTNCGKDDYSGADMGRGYMEQEEENYQDFLSKHYDD